MAQSWLALMPKLAIHCCSKSLTHVHFSLHLAFLLQFMHNAREILLRRQPLCWQRSAVARLSDSMAGLLKWRLTFPMKLPLSRSLDFPLLLSMSRQKNAYIQQSKRVDISPLSKGSPSTFPLQTYL